MRKLICAVALLVASTVVVPAAMAGTVGLTLSATSTNTMFTISGIYAPGTPSIPSFSAPGSAYSLSFTVLTNGAANSGFVPDTTDGIFFVNADMTLAFGGSTTNLGTLQIEFDNTLNGNMGGLFFCVAAPATCPTDAASWSIVGQQLFTGSVTSPNFQISGLTLGGTLNAQVNETLSGYEINGLSFPFSGAPTPEPASMLLLGTGLLGVGFITRRKLVRR